MRDGPSVAIIGGGVAGLAAALELAQAGWPVTVCEARPRLGGRILTLRSGEIPLELGAEFIHGNHELLWQHVRAAGLKAIKVPDRNHWLADGTLQPVDLWREVGQVMGRIDTHAPDQSLREFLAAQEMPDSLKQLATAFVEGFDAADPGKASVHALRAAEWSKGGQGSAQYRLAEGYSALIAFLAEQSAARGVRIKTNTRVRSIRWRPGHVEVLVEQEGQETMFEARAAIVTVPLGVLKSGDVRFEPPLPSKARAIERLEYGNVVKLVLRFHHAFWPEPDFGFVHAFSERIPTWWSNDRLPVLTGWAGGPKADALASWTHGELVNEALGILGRLFHVNAATIRRELAEAHTHDWRADPFSRGAYSYIPVNGLDLPGMLATPVAETLFFAGEATAKDVEPGTVHGALDSGVRAARELRQASGDGGGPVRAPRLERPRPAVETFPVPSPSDRAR